MHTQIGACVSLGMVLRLSHLYKEKGGKGWVLGEKFTTYVVFRYATPRTIHPPSDSTNP